MSRETVDRIAAELKKENYQPNILGWQLKKQRTGTIGVILGDLTRTLSLNILAGIEAVLADADYLTLVCNSRLGELESKHLATLGARRVEGIILSPNGDSTNGSVLARLSREKMPVVLVDNYLSRLKTDFVVSDNFRGAYQATQALLKKGCRSIAYVGARKDLAVLRDRFEGYRRALRDHRRPFLEELVCKTMTRPEDAYTVMKQLFSGKAPDALFVESLVYFREGFRFLADRRLRIPEDVAITGFDPIDLGLETGKDGDRLRSLIKSPLPFVEQDGFGMGKSAAEILLKKISAKTRATKQIFIKPKLHHCSDAA